MSRSCGSGRESGRRARSLDLRGEGVYFILFDHIVIRPFVPADQPVVRRLILEGLGEHFGFIDETMNPDVDDIVAHFIAPGHIFLVAQCEMDIVGTAALIFVGDGVAQMVRVSVSAQHRRRGIGRMLVNRLVGIARERGLQRIEVETNNDWENAIGLYQCYGFVEHDRDDVSVYMSLPLK